MVIDCLSAYNQIPCMEDTTKMPTVALPQEQLQFLMAGQGICNRRSAWCLASDKDPKDMPTGKEIDDVITQAAGPSGKAKNIRQVLKASRKVECGNEVVFSGKLLTDYGRFLLERNIDVIRNFQSPTTKTELR